MKEVETLCLTCDKTTCECKWLSQGIEADDWKASIKVVDEKGQQIERVIVLECPRYKPMKR